MNAQGNTPEPEPVDAPREDVKEMRLDDVLESIPLGMYHYRLLVICGMAFMVSL
jgi:hypothetical protein